MAERRARWMLRGLLLVAVLALLQGCATRDMRVPADPESAQGTMAVPAGTRWWHARFRFSRAEMSQTNSYLDGLVAVESLAPVIEALGAEIPLWRFHRRWPDDSVGHQFSFLFFADRATAQAVRVRLEGDPLLPVLAAEGHLRAWFVEPSAASDAALVGATSDDRWPPELQREWPYFIMGSSRMWLGLLRHEVAAHPAGDLHARYRAVERAIDRLWFREADHALFHHLSALFGYRPMRIRGGEQMTF